MTTIMIYLLKIKKEIEMKIARIVIGLLLIGYAVYSGNVWFYLGVIILLTGVFNWCPMEKLLGRCKDGKCDDGSCCSSKPKDEESSCCSTTSSNESCCTPSKDAKAQKISGFSTTAVPKSPEGVTQILILGTGCAKCIALKNSVDIVIKELEGEFEVKKVEDIETIMSYGVVSTPGFVINGVVKSTGKALSQNEIKELVLEAQKSA